MENFTKPKKSHLSVTEIGQTLAAELGEIVDRLGEDNPDLIGEILRYIGGLDSRHPDWRFPMERAQARLVGGARARHSNSVPQ